MAKELLKGNIAIAEAAVRVGLEAYFGYPITPQTELLEYLSARMPALGRIFLQAESEVAAINMVYGAACTGARVMSSSSSPGFSLMQEGLSYIAGSELPCVVVDMMRGGPGLGNILPAQGDYFQVTRSAGHGDFHPIVLAPASVQEAIDFTVLAFELADKYRHMVIIAADGQVGQMMEPAELPAMRPVRLKQERSEWALTGAKGRSKRVIASIYLKGEDEEAFNNKIQARLRQIKHDEQRWVEYATDDAELVVIGFGTAGRIALSAVESAREKGLKVGLLRPQTIWPFPEDRIRQLNVRGCLVVEMNAGQMIDDVRLAVEGHFPVSFYGRMGGMIPTADEILSAIEKLGTEVQNDHYV